MWAHSFKASKFFKNLSQQFFTEQLQVNYSENLKNIKNTFIFPISNVGVVIKSQNF